MERRYILFAIGSVAFAGIVLMLYASRAGIFYAETCKEGEVLAIFSPENSDEILALLNGAKREIKLEVYEFSYRTLADALIEARSRGVSVQVVLEPSVSANTKTSEYLLNGGVSVAWASKKFHNTHSKFAVIDDGIVLVGSTNWSQNAMLYNREASVIVYSNDVAKSFERIFDADFGAG
jgi:phosphatidylserine/phosphatidylglycerophosphate/cardiolipin synthase-like enzyme